MGIHNETRARVSPSSEPVNSDLLIEARMALANAALYRQDTAKALSLYSRVKTAHSAWNQSQVMRCEWQYHGGRQISLRL